MGDKELCRCPSCGTENGVDNGLSYLPFIACTIMNLHLIFSIDARGSLRSSPTGLTLPYRHCDKPIPARLPRALCVKRDLYRASCKAVSPRACHLATRFTVPPVYHQYTILHDMACTEHINFANKTTPNSAQDAGILAYSDHAFRELTAMALINTDLPVSTAYDKSKAIDNLYATRNSHTPCATFHVRCAVNFIPYESPAHSVTQKYEHIQP